MRDDGQEGGSKPRLERGEASSPLGTIEVLLEDGAPVGVRFRERDENEARAPRTGEADRIAEGVVDLVEGRQAEVPSPRPTGTRFQCQVWEAISAIPIGETATYSEIATRVGRPRATRAVASACAANPVALIVPCHRVVMSDGSPGGYRWGVERKAALLESERKG